MTHADLETSVRDVIENYWRVCAASALYRDAYAGHSGSLRYGNIPLLGAVSGLLTTESVEAALAALHAYTHERLARDLFLSLIACFEARLSERLSTLGLTTTGTLGALQARIQSRLAVDSASVENVDEIRERRNVLMHHAGRANANYIRAAQKVCPRAPSYVPVPQIGASVVPDGAYLTYAGNALIMYSSVL